MVERLRAAVIFLVLVFAAAILFGWPIETAMADEPETQFELALKYAPVIAINKAESACSKGEPFYPVAVDVLFGRNDVRLLGPDGERISAPVAANLANRGDGWRLDLPGNALEGGCDYARWFESLDASPVIYARVATDLARPGELALQYWMFWVYNDWNGRHEGDWELVHLTFNASDAVAALQANPSKVTFAQHSRSETRDWEGGGARFDEGQIVVFPARGSHAAYFEPRLWLSSNAATGLACDDARSADTFIRPDVQMLSSGPGGQPWLSFEGRWGEEHAAFNNGPRGPAFQRPWDEPFTWMDGDSNRPPVAMRGPDSMAGRAFCSSARSISLGYNHLLEAGIGVRFAVIALGIVALGGAAVQPARRIRAKRWAALTSRVTWTVLLSAGVAATGVAWLLAEITPLGDLARLSGPSHPLTSLAYLVIGVPVLALAAWTVGRSCWRASPPYCALSVLIAVLAAVVFGAVTGMAAGANVVTAAGLAAALAIARGPTSESAARR